MKTHSISTLSFSLLLTVSCTLATSADRQDMFLQCLTYQFKNYSSISDYIYTPLNSSYTSILQFSIQNIRLASETTPKPQVIITPEHESQIPSVVRCARQSGLEIRTRSGGHDMEGLSYVSQVSFVIIDLINLSDVTVNVEEKTAWIEAGVTTGIVYYKIAEKSPTLGFPGAIFTKVGVCGHFSGGGYEAMVRKHGLAADNIVDARIIDVHGRIIGRKSMGEDLFRAIRGGGAAKTVTVFSITRNAEEQNGIELWHRWQYLAPQADKDLFVGVIVLRVNMTVQVNFFSVFQGGPDRLVSNMQESSPCLRQLKTKSDYVRKQVPLNVIEGMVSMLREPKADGTMYYMVPYGGRMNEISESATPFPHRVGALYQLASLTYWQNSEAGDPDRYYEYMTPYVSSSPKEAYYNYRDLDIGVNNPNG
ncbi:berberine bridge enzyme-like 18 [Salvia splendens]|uniref:berberine bridge enzyme-like 18 n=1 Tax=Salvia splendens TaxID=180675 RepID=UPI001C258504|nr:berberine bridge enzyme-like 18 [Salvia splendens]